LFHVLKQQANRASVLVIDALISRMDSILIINILIPVLDAHGEESEIKQACLNTLKSVLDKCAVGSLNNDIVDNIMPSILQCYESSLSNTRKSACFCLVSLHRVIGNDELLPRLQCLPQGKLKLLQLYIKRQKSG